MFYLYGEIFDRFHSELGKLKIEILKSRSRIWIDKPASNKRIIDG